MFPNDRKYISLYPDGTYVPHERSADASASGDPETDAARASMRSDIRQQMKAETLAVDPETELEERPAADPVAVAPPPRAKARSARSQTSAGSSRPRSERASKPIPASAAGAEVDRPIADDDFFET